MCVIIRVKRAASCCPGQNEDICPSIKKSMDCYIPTFNMRRLVSGEISRILIHRLGKSLKLVEMDERFRDFFGIVPLIQYGGRFFGIVPYNSRTSIIQYGGRFDV